MATYTEAAIAATRSLSPWYPSKEGSMPHSFRMSEAEARTSVRRSAFGVTNEAMRSGYSNPGQNSKGRTSVSQNSDSEEPSSREASKVTRQGTASAAEMRSEGSREIFMCSLRSSLVPDARPSILKESSTMKGGSDLMVKTTFLRSSPASAVALMTGFMPFL